VSAKTNRQNSHLANLKKAKPSLSRPSWHQEQFFLPMLLQRISNTLASAFHKKTAPGTQVRALVAPFGTNSGFTIVELTISLTVMGIIMVSLMAASVNYLVIITRNNITIDMTVDSQNLLRSTVEELRYGAGVRSSNTITDANEPGGGWTTTNTNFVIIIAAPAEDSSGDYIIDPSTGVPYNNELVYFKGTTDNKLYKRILANSNATGNTAVTTCPASVASASCPADIQLINYIDTMQFTLYDQDDATTTDALLARSVKIDLTTTRDTFGSPLTLDNSIRVTLRNDFL